MANMVRVFYSDGSSSSFRYRLPKVARYLKRMKEISKFREIANTPLFPWLFRMAWSDATTTALDREITRIEILEKTK